MAEKLEKHSQIIIIQNTKTKIMVSIDTKNKLVIVTGDDSGEKTQEQDIVRDIMTMVEVSGMNDFYLRMSGINQDIAERVENHIATAVGVKKVFDYLQNEYVESDVTSGEYIYSVVLPIGIGSWEAVTEGVNRFLEWDESDEKVEVWASDRGWEVKEA